MTISRDQLFKVLNDHHMTPADVRDFFAEFGQHARYDVRAVRLWLGY